MEWGESGELADEMGGGGGLGYANANVMTDEQVQLLQKQISIYTALTEQLADMHSAQAPHGDSTAAAGVSLGGLYYEPTMVTGGHKFPAGRHRWMLTPMQLEILEGIFGEGHGTPSKQRIEDITAELSQHGQISVTNVYNWFQNRRARWKRKQAAASSLPNTNAESEAGADEESQADRKPASDAPLIYQENTHVGAQSSEQVDAVMYDGYNDDSSIPPGSWGHMPFYESIIPNPGFDHSS